MMEYNKTKPMSVSRSICITAVMTAFICIMTIVPRIPIPLGYAHLGDAAIFLVVLYAGHREGAVAASLGSAFADFLGGFPIWILPTILIKYCMVIILWHIVKKHAADIHVLSAYAFCGLCLSGGWMVIGYTLFGSILYGGIAVGLTSAPGLFLEGVVNIAAAIAAGAVLERSRSFSAYFK
jgi:uncharacterized membrane protein